MANELDTLSNNEIAPYDAGMPVLAPIQPDSWAQPLTDREINEYQRQPQGPTLFGSQLPPGTTKQQVDVVLGQLGAAFMNDMSTLAYPAHMVQAAIRFMQENATKAPCQVTPRHNFNLHGQDDWLGHLFGNAIYELSGSPRAKQSFVTAAIQWLAKATAKLNQAPVGQETLPRTAPSTSSEAMLSQLSDSDFSRVLKINEQAQINSLATLAAKHGQYTAQNMVALAQAHLEKLTPRERQHFDQFTTVNGVNWVHILNCAETIEFLYNASIGSGTLPTSGAAISAEIKEIEALLATPIGRRAYFKDPQLQARYRTLLDSVK
ncbi:hypothetical protein JFU47_32110 [Pseudomonas sp. TH39(2020)]|uniref:hypothetical protein n=1 Tax=Pseudomonas sp. TH39(2020) TaxID=2796349 RepID=UPI001912F95E|nr:hypothetical protein [Pseudomonas sp. TH39(2020)]MBK5401322.1 hypothetical protein [Pseudomonas sp. TH39(2020)]